MENYRVTVYAQKLEPQWPVSLLIKAIMAYGWPAAYHGDIYHDIEFIQKLCAKITSQTPTPADRMSRPEFPTHLSHVYWVLRECGTGIGESERDVGYWWDQKQNKRFKLWLEKDDNNHSYTWRLEEQE